ncbi:hypothetical protein VLK31_35625 [Variovorax sp. H27-G14]|uniref:DUF6896 domain-containing protein n=1 Tax=Variovorax sp. H27-G14 TaxID=3111914 RepID=UPI0038FC52CB
MNDDLIRELLECQRRLSAALLQRYPEVQGNKWLLGVQIAEDLEVHGEHWAAQKHGSGVVFTRQAPVPHLVVDMHTAVSEPEVIDPWRVQQFAESKGQPLRYDEAESLLYRASMG